MKVFLAATKGMKKHAHKLRESKYILESFYDVEEWQMPYLKSCEMFLLDSGAFTFMNTGKKVDFDSYTDKYIDFINHHDIKYFFEMDIDSVLGLPKVEELRKRIERRTGKQPIPVWHFNRGKEDFIQICKDYPYVAFGGLITDGLSKSDLYKYMPWFINTAHEHGAMIHGLGFTATKDLHRFHFDTVDSSTWINGGRFGNVCVFRDGVIKQLHDSSKRVIDSEGIMIHNFETWCKFQRYAETKL